MWSSVVGGSGCDVPGARHKHAMCINHPHVYLLGGRHGNLPLKDFWTYDLTTRTWQEIKNDRGSRPPSLQQHTMVLADNKLLVFGGELCMSNETPLWIYSPQTKEWSKWRGEASTRAVGIGRIRAGGASGPTGRRGHTAVMVGDSMLIYGGYQDLRGSSAELWSFNTKDQTWSQLSSRGEQPAPRHAHSAVLHDNHVWVYGGMTDLQERGDFWRYDTVGRTWTQIRARPSPGCLHSHVAAKLHSSMVVFGGERQGEVLNDLWRFHFATCTWERLMSSGIRPQPRSQFCAFVAPSHHIKGPRFHSASSHTGSSTSSRSSSGYGSGYSSHDSYKTRRIHPDCPNPSKDLGDSCGCEDCEDDLDLDPTKLRNLIQRNCSNAPTTQLKLSISKFSQLNLSHLGRYYSYSMLSNDSTESIVEESLASTCDSLGSKIVKSQSIHFTGKEKEAKNEVKSGMTRDIVSFPNFGDLKSESDDSGSHYPINQVKVITVMPAEGQPEASLEDDPSDIMADIKGRLAFSQDAIQSADTSISENLMSFSCTTDSNLSSNTNLYGPSSYNACTTDSLSSNYGPNYPISEVRPFNEGPTFNPSSFANPNYVGFDPGIDRSNRTGGLLSQDYWRAGALDLESMRHKEFAEMLRTPPDSGIGLGVEMERRTPLDLNIQTLEDFVTFDSQSTRFNNTHNIEDPDSRTHDQATKDSNRPAQTRPVQTDYRPVQTDNRPGQSRPAQTTQHTQGNDQPSRSTDNSKSASSTSAKVTFSTGQHDTPGGSSQGPQGSAEGTRDPPAPRINPFMREEPVRDLYTPNAMYIVGGKEIDQMTAFKRPISVWKLDLPF